MKHHALFNINKWIFENMTSVMVRKQDLSDYTTPGSSKTSVMDEYNIRQMWQT
jgi:hypothetical protein